MCVCVCVCVCVCACVCVCVCVCGEGAREREKSCVVHIYRYALQSHKDCTWEVLADVANVGGPAALAAFRQSQEASEAKRKVSHIEWRPSPKAFKFVACLLVGRVFAKCA